MKESELIVYIEETAGIVYAGNSAAYEAFATGKTIFDIAPGAPFLHKFRQYNASEFGKHIETDGAGGFRFMKVFDTDVYCTYNRHLHHKYKVAPKLEKIEKEDPELF